MKKTITVNLNGRVFTMDDDAYRLLENYLSNLRIYFRKEEGASEIIADFESRIEELLSEKTNMGFQVITIEHVEEVIARVGKPADFAERDDMKDEGQNIKDEKQTYFTETKGTKKKFFRNVDDKMFGGVCSGLAAYLGTDVLAVRIIFIILLIVSSLWFALPYLLAWILIPAAQTAEQKLQMRGKPITIENIGKTVAAEVEQVLSNEPKGCLAGFIDLFVNLLKILLVGFGILTGLFLVFILVIIVIVLIAVFFGVGGGLLGAFPSFLVINHPVLGAITLLLIAGIPIVVLIYSIIAAIGKFKPLDGWVKGGFLFIWILALILFLFSGFKIDKHNWRRNWHWSWGEISDNHLIKGNGLLSEKTYILETPVDYVENGKYLFANLHIEQIQSDTASIVISGDENLIEQINYELNDGRLVLNSHNRLFSENNLKIKLRTKDLKGVKSIAAGIINIENDFTVDDLDIRMSGPGKLHAHNLHAQTLTVNADGVASVDLSGRATRVNLTMSGAGKIDALHLVSDTVYACVNGVGLIKCNPVDYLNGQLRGVGKISYKDEPKSKTAISAGIGVIGKE